MAKFLIASLNYCRQGQPLASVECLSQFGEDICSEDLRDLAKALNKIADDWETLAPAGRHFSASRRSYPLGRNDE